VFIDLNDGSIDAGILGLISNFSFDFIEKSRRREWFEMLVLLPSI